MAEAFRTNIVLRDDEARFFIDTMVVNTPEEMKITSEELAEMQQIAKNPVVAISGEWFTAHGLGENLGHVLLPENRAVMEILRAAFAAWYDNGHTNEADLNTCLLKISLTDGVMFSDGNRYEFTTKPY